MKKLPVDVSNFELMIKGNYLYIDKTKIIYDLISNARLFFLSRPRRFGKSLLISTLKEIYSGNKSLFNELWIGKYSNYDWIEYPVIHLDFSEIAQDSVEAFKIDLIFALEEIAEKNALDISMASSPTTKLKKLITSLAQKNKVVILLDEYDAPLLNNLENNPNAYAILKTMKLFFNVIKSYDAKGYIHAIFITGVTKIAKTSIFSGLNNLNDLTMMPEAGDLLGYTQEELLAHFKSYSDQFVQENNIPTTDFIDSIKSWYDGYRFSRAPMYVYNPYSVINCFYKKEIANYWLTTGTPQFLIELLRKNVESIEKITKTEASSEFLGTFDIGELPLIPILYQAGYLTIAQYNVTEKTYTLDYPNIEVHASFNKYIVASLTATNERNVEIAARQLKNALAQNDIAFFCVTLQSLFANIPYNLHIKKESYYHSLLQLMLDLLGYKGHSEVATSAGKIDLVIETEKQIFIFEFKFSSRSQKALDQIIEKRYYEKYQRFNKPISLIGISFSMKNKKLTLDWKKADLQQ